MMNIKKTTYARTVHKWTFTGKDLIEALKRVGFNVPAHAEVEFKVPSGGDWSGMSVAIDEKWPVTITWTEETEEEE